MTANITLQRSAYPGITSDRFAGTACTGSDKALNRELNVLNGISIISVDRRVLIPGDDYTVNGHTATFNIPVDDRARLVTFR